MFNKRNIYIDILAILFGIGAWLSVNGLWVELPILVEHLPESWALPSYVTTFTQIANIPTLAYGIFHKCCPEKVTETAGTIVVMVIGVASCLLLVFFWDSTLYVCGELHSMGLLILVSFLSIVDCTSSIMFIPFMARFSKTYLISYFIGEGFSGLIPSIVALAQGVGGNVVCLNVSNGTDYIIQKTISEPNFSVKTFLYVILGMMCTSFMAFLFLRLYPWPSRYYSYPTMISISKIRNHGSYNFDEEICDENANSSSENVESAPLISTNRPSHKTFILNVGFKLVIIMWINFFLNGVLMSIQSFSCLPYGNEVYHLSVTLSNAANPIFCSLAFWKPSTTKRMMTIVTILSSLIGVYVLTLAILSPFPPYVGTSFGSGILVKCF
ncbi:hypothetical protein CHUAL_013936 [Chamberlinius hualienensis]